MRPTGTSIMKTDFLRSYYAKVRMQICTLMHIINRGQLFKIINDVVSLVKIAKDSQILSTSICLSLTFSLSYGPVTH